MSHFSRIKTSFVVEEYILKALEDLGYQYEKGEVSVRGFGGAKTPVQIKINIPLSYDIGLQKNNGQYQIIADWYGVLGVKRDKFVEQLTQRYAYHATVDKLTQQGFDIVEEKNEKGEIKMVLRRMV